MDSPAQRAHTKEPHADTFAEPLFAETIRRIRSSLDRHLGRQCPRLRDAQRGPHATVKSGDGAGVAAPNAGTWGRLRHERSPAGHVMSRRCCIFITLTVVTISVGMVRYATAQAPASDLIAAARKDIEALDTDSATALLHRALDPRAGATPAERVRALVLLAASELIAGRPDSARTCFREALALDPRLNVDSLASLHSFFLTTFEAERLAQASHREPPDVLLQVALDLPLDTIVMGSGVYRISYSPSMRADVSLAIAPTNAPLQPIWTGTQTVDSVGANWWSVRYADGTRVPSGRYLLRVTATDSRGDSTTTERILVVTMIPDTVPSPPPLAPSAFAPESVTVHGSSSGRWLSAIAALVVAGTAGQRGLLYGIVVFPIALFIEHVATHHTAALPDNVAQNERIRAQDRQVRDSISQSNARALADPPVRIWVEGRIR